MLTPLPDAKWLRSSWIGIMRFTDLGPLLDSNLWFQDPGAVTFRAFGGLGELCLRKLEAASATESGFDLCLVIRML